MDERRTLPAQGDTEPAEPCCDCECGNQCPPNCECC
jgi:hypothetical protein